METTKTTETEDELLTTTDAADDAESVTNSEDDVTSQFDYDYSELDDLYEKYFGDTDTDTDSLYSTTGYDTTSYDTTDNTSIENAVAAAVSTLMSVMLFVVFFTIAYRIYMAVTKFMIAKKMGRSTAFAILSILFWPIMAGILAFSKKKDGSGNNATPATPATPVTPEVEAQATPAEKE